MLIESRSNVDVLVLGSEVVVGSGDFRNHSAEAASRTPDLDEQCYYYLKILLITVLVSLILWT
jgi:hypothetical protein